MSTYPIEQIPDERLARLMARRCTSRGILVTLADCAPFLTTFPLECDELRHVLVRLLTVPGGPLVSHDGTPRRVPRTRLLWIVSYKSFDELAPDDIGMGTDGWGNEEHIDLARVRYLVEYEVTCSLERARRQPWWSYAKDLLELAVWHHPVDAMLAGLSAVREYNNNTQQGEET